MIRAGEIGDRDKIVEMRHKLQTHVEKSNPYIWSLTEKGRKNIASNVNEFLDNPDSVVYVHEESGNVVGYIDGIIRYRTTLLPPVVGQIGTMFVEESYRRKGIGKSLVRKICSHFEEKGVDEVNLRYVIGNKEADSFWSSLGLRPVIRTTLINLKEIMSNLEKA
jgi:GNAT superfamily N-acetyltransferase